MKQQEVRNVEKIQTTSELVYVYYCDDCKKEIEHFSTDNNVCCICGKHICDKHQQYSDLFYFEPDYDFDSDYKEEDIFCNDCFKHSEKYIKELENLRNLINKKYDIIIKKFDKQCDIVKSKWRKEKNVKKEIEDKNNVI